MEVSLLAGQDRLYKVVDDKSAYRVLPHDDRASIEHPVVQMLVAEMESHFRQPVGTDDIRLIARAYAIAAKAHQEQFRKSGEPFIHHPVEVAKIAIQIGMDPESIEAALLHSLVLQSSTRNGTSFQCS